MPGVHGMTSVSRSDSPERKNESPVLGSLESAENAMSNRHDQRVEVELLSSESKTLATSPKHGESTPEPFAHQDHARTSSPAVSDEEGGSGQPSSLSDSSPGPSLVMQRITADPLEGSSRLKTSNSIGHGDLETIKAATQSSAELREKLTLRLGQSPKKPSKSSLKGRKLKSPRRGPTPVVDSASSSPGNLSASTTPIKWTNVCVRLEERNLDGPLQPQRKHVGASDMKRGLSAKEYMFKLSSDTMIWHLKVKLFSELMKFRYEPSTLMMKSLPGRRDLRNETLISEVGAESELNILALPIPLRASHPRLVEKSTKGSSALDRLRVTRKAGHAAIPQWSFAFGRGLTKAVADLHAEFYIYPTNKNFGLVSLCDERFSVEFEEVQSHRIFQWPVTVTQDPKTGMQVVSFKPTQAGHFHVHVTLRKAELFGSPYNLQVLVFGTVQTAFTELMKLGWNVEAAEALANYSEDPLLHDTIMQALGVERMLKIMSSGDDSVRLSMVSVLLNLIANPAMHMRVFVDSKFQLVCCLLDQINMDTKISDEAGNVLARALFLRLHDLEARERLVNQLTWTPILRLSRIESIETKAYIVRSIALVCESSVCRGLLDSEGHQLLDFLGGLVTESSFGLRHWVVRAVEGLCQMPGLREHCINLYQSLVEKSISFPDAEVTRSLLHLALLLSDFEEGRVDILIDSNVHQCAISLLTEIYALRCWEEQYSDSFAPGTVLVDDDGARNARQGNLLALKLLRRCLRTVTESNDDGFTELLFHLDAFDVIARLAASRDADVQQMACLFLEEACKNNHMKRRLGNANWGIWVFAAAQNLNLEHHPEVLRCMAMISTFFDETFRLMDEKSTLQMIHNGLSGNGVSSSLKADLAMVAGNLARLPQYRNRIVEAGGSPFFSHVLDLVRKGQLEVHDHLDEKDLEFVGSLDEGAGSKVERVRYRGKEYAAKMFDADNICYNHEEFLSELAIMTLVQHPRIVTCAAGSSKPSCLTILCDLFQRGSLKDIIDNHEANLDIPVIVRLCMDIAEGMAYLHSLGIIHRDLKPGNILVSSDWRVSITDFGASRSWAQRMTPSVGTVSYMAPDVIESETYTKSVDVFSFGIILWEMLERRSPYQNAVQAVDVVMMVKEGRRPEFSDIPPTEGTDRNSIQRLKALRQLTQRCWNQDAAKRPSFQEILQIMREIDAQIPASALAGVMVAVQSVPEKHRHDSSAESKPAGPVLGISQDRVAPAVKEGGRRVPTTLDLEEVELRSEKVKPKLRRRRSKSMAFGDDLLEGFTDAGMDFRPIQDGEGSTVTSDAETADSSSSKRNWISKKLQKKKPRRFDSEDDKTRKMERTISRETSEGSQPSASDLHINLGSLEKKGKTSEDSCDSPRKRPNKWKFWGKDKSVEDLDINASEVDEEGSDGSDKRPQKKKLRRLLSMKRNVGEGDETLSEVENSISSKRSLTRTKSPISKGITPRLRRSKSKPKKPSTLSPNTDSDPLMHLSDTETSDQSVTDRKLSSDMGSGPDGMMKSGKRNKPSKTHYELEHLTGRVYDTDIEKGPETAQNVTKENKSAHSAHFSQPGSQETEALNQNTFLQEDADSRFTDTPVSAEKSRNAEGDWQHPEETTESLEAAAVAWPEHNSDVQMGNGIPPVSEAVAEARTDNQCETGKEGKDMETDIAGRHEHETRIEGDEKEETNEEKAHHAKEDISEKFEHDQVIATNAKTVSSAPIPVEFEAVTNEKEANAPAKAVSKQEPQSTCVVVCRASSNPREGPADDSYVVSINLEGRSLEQAEITAESKGDAGVTGEREAGGEETLSVSKWNVYEDAKDAPDVRAEDNVPPALQATDIATANDGRSLIEPTQANDAVDVAGSDTLEKDSELVGDSDVLHQLLGAIDDALGANETEERKLEEPSPRTAAVSSEQDATIGTEGLEGSRLEHGTESDCARPSSSGDISRHSFEESKSKRAKKSKEEKKKKTKSRTKSVDLSAIQEEEMGKGDKKKKRSSKSEKAEKSTSRLSAGGKKKSFLHRKKRPSKEDGSEKKKVRELRKLWEQS